MRDDELIPCPVCDGRGARKTTGYNPSTGNTFQTTELCPTCKGDRRIKPEDYPAWLKTPTKRIESTEDKPWG